MQETKKSFNHYKLHTQYSICEGAVKIDELAEYCKKNNIGMAYINSNYKRRNSVDSYKSMIKHSKNMKYNYQYLVDNKSKLANTFKAKTTPHIFLLMKLTSLYIKVLLIITTRISLM